jgi:hypothetical protein
MSEPNQIYNAVSAATWSNACGRASLSLRTAHGVEGELVTEQGEACPGSHADDRHLIRVGAPTRWRKSTTSSLSS